MGEVFEYRRGLREKIKKYELRNTKYETSGKFDTLCLKDYRYKPGPSMNDLKQRTFNFAVEVATLIRDLPENQLNKAYTSQLIRSSSSIGANYRAAKRAKSDADFINKLKIAEEEADETLYFLELLNRFNEKFSIRINLLIDEGTAILKIQVASITSRSRIKNS